MPDHVSDHDRDECIGMAQAETTSKFIARLLGPVLAVAGIPMVFNANTYRTLIEEILISDALVYVAGLLALVAGLTIINVHNSWSFGWPLIITVFGWLCAIGGTIRMTAPELVETLAGAVYQRPGVVEGMGVAVLLIGCFLSFKGYSA
jgi:hypothetical protein